MHRVLMKGRFGRVNVYITHINVSKLIKTGSVKFRPFPDPGGFKGRLSEFLKSEKSKRSSNTEGGDIVY